MYPKFKDGVCEVVSIEPEYVECVDESLCYKTSKYERYRLYIIDIIGFDKEGSLRKNYIFYRHQDISCASSTLSQKFHPSLIIL